MKKEEIKFFDIHSHLHSEFFKGDLEEVLKEMKDQNV
jgi:Tat protein secretion system quality control protein TatD with DNase activity